MQKTIQKFGSFADAEKADAAYYRSLSPGQRLDILLAMVEQMQPRDETERRLKRVYRIVELAES